MADTNPLDTNAITSTPAPLTSTGGRIQPGAFDNLLSIAGKALGFSFQNQNGTAIQSEDDWRVRVSMAPIPGLSAPQTLFYNDSNAITKPLVATNGVVFPYTPTVAIGHNARYGTSQLTHSNYSSYFYEGSEVQAITISGDFTVQNIAEGQYLMAVVQFFRACTKMFFGNDNIAGTPPPMVFLDGYGSTYLPHVPCVVTSFNHTMPGDVDYVNIPVGVDLNNVAGNQFGVNFGTGMTRLPTMSTISVTLQPVYSRKNISTFSLGGFVAGGGIETPRSTRGGFL